jgi:hypothetical protein
VPGTAPSIRSRASLLSSLTEDITGSLHLARFPCSTVLPGRAWPQPDAKGLHLATDDSANGKLVWWATSFNEA